MNIGFNLVVAGEKTTGAREYLHNLLRELLLLEGPERYTVYLRRDESPEVEERLRSFRPGTRFVRTPLPMTPTPVRVLRGELYWRRQVREDALDVFHHTYFPLPRGVERECAVVLSLHDLIQRGMPEAFTTGRRLFTNFVQPGTFRRADRIAVISGAVVEDLGRFHPEVDRGKVDVVPCAVDEVYLERGEGDGDPTLEAEVRRRYELPERYILGVGHLETRKNWARLIRAYAGVREAVGEAAPKLVIVGVENWDFQPIYEAAEETGVRPHISFTGYVEREHLPEVYAQAMIFAYPSLYEGFGIPVLEAMASGVPVLTSTVTSLPEVSGGAACLVDPYSEEAIRDGLLRLVRDDGYRAELVARGRENVRRYSWHDSAKRMRDVYRSVAGGRTDGGGAA